MQNLKPQTLNRLLIAFVLVLLGIGGEMDYQDKKQRFERVEAVQEEWQVTASILNRLSDDYEESLADE